MRSAGTCLSNNSLRLNHCSHKQQQQGGGAESRGGWEKTEKCFFNHSCKEQKAGGGEKLLDRHQISLARDGSPSAELCNLALTTIQFASLQRSICSAGRWTPASLSRCVICLINLINIHTALDCSQKRRLWLSLCLITTWWVISQKRPDNSAPQATEKLKVPCAYIALHVFFAVALMRLWRLF